MARSQGRGLQGGCRRHTSRGPVSRQPVSASLPRLALLHCSQQQGMRHGAQLRAEAGAGARTCAPHLASTTSQGARYLAAKFVWQRRRWLSLHRLQAVLAQPRFLQGTLRECRGRLGGAAGQPWGRFARGHGTAKRARRRRASS